MRYEREEGALVRLEQTFSESRGDLPDSLTQMKRVAGCLILAVIAFVVIVVFASGASIGGYTALLLGLLAAILILVWSITRGPQQGIVQIVEFNKGTGRIEDRRQANGKLVSSKQMSMADVDAIHIDVFDQNSRVAWKLYIFSKKERKPYMLLFKQCIKTMTNSTEILRMKDFLLELTDDMRRIVKTGQPGVRKGINYNEAQAIEVTTRGSNEKNMGLFMLSILFLLFGFIGAILGGGWLVMEWIAVITLPAILTGAHILIPIFIVCSVLLVVGLILFIKESRKKVN
jgi:uncharacterized membrane protein